MILGWQLRRLQSKSHIKTIGIVGSYGKTSTKFAIAMTLKQHFRVRFQEGNYNHPLTVPLVFFDEKLPGLSNPLAWLLLFIRNELHLRRPYPYDIVVLELGTDGPGQINVFSRYLKLDLAVVTSISYEHMEFFSDLQAVADEELSVKNFSKHLVINIDLCAKEYISDIDIPIITYGYNNNQADYSIVTNRDGQDKQIFTINYQGTELLEAPCQNKSKAFLYSACASAVVGNHYQMPPNTIVEGIKSIKPVSGRMQLLRGVRGSTIIDETYNASPAATKAALDVLYDMESPQKIALLGNMNELGNYSPAAHTEVGEYCNPNQLDLIITIGPDANEYLAPAASARGCQVKTFKTPFDAGDYLKSNIKEGAIVLVKGSQNQVFAEEAIKAILADPKDTSRLVRQSPEWLKKKALNFRDADVE